VGPSVRESPDPGRIRELDEATGEWKAKRAAVAGGLLREAWTATVARRRYVFNTTPCILL